MKRTIIAVALATSTITAAVAGESLHDLAIRRCAEIYVVRNNFFNARGLCFTNRAALENYPNNPATCRYDHAADVPLSKNEKTWIAGLVAEERMLGCPKLR